jgi:hypothetical protein
VCFSGSFQFHEKFDVTWLSFTHNFSKLKTFIKSYNWTLHQCNSTWFSTWLGEGWTVINIMSKPGAACTASFFNNHTSYCMWTKFSQLTTNIHLYMTVSSSILKSKWKLLLSSVLSCCHSLAHLNSASQFHVVTVRFLECAERMVVVTTAPWLAIGVRRITYITTVWTLALHIIWSVSFLQCCTFKNWTPELSVLHPV